MVVNSFLVWVVLKMLFFRIKSAVTLNAMENNHIAKYGSAESNPFWGTVLNKRGDLRMIQRQNTDSDFYFRSRVYRFQVKMQDGLHVCWQFCK